MLEQRNGGYMKRVLFLVFAVLLLFAGTALADTITAYKVPSSAPLNQEITATGIYTAADGNHPLVWCSFYILDLNGNVVYPATDQLSTSTGRFRMAPKLLTEPLTVRGQTYDLHSECGTATADANFTVSQKQEAFSIMGVAFYPAGGFLDLLYLRDNSLVLFGFFLIIMFFVCLGVIWWNNFFG
jgi:hypothetical protein